MAKDIFAKIAEDGMGGRKECLCDPEPMKFSKEICTLNETVFPAFEIKRKMSQKSELYSALKETREYYKPFLRDLAPKIEPYNKRTYIRNFVLDGSGEITVPEYGGPLGNAKKTYEAVFEIHEIRYDKAYYIRFLGADYKAFVYVNDICVGTHEGFFSPF